MIWQRTVWMSSLIWKSLNRFSKIIASHLYIIITSSIVNLFFLYSFISGSWIFQNKINNFVKGIVKDFITKAIWAMLVIMLSKKKIDNIN